MAELDGTARQHFTCVPLTAHLNNKGLTTTDRLAEGGFNIWGNSFPAKELPPAGSTWWAGGVPFLFPAQALDGSDNLRCRAQRLPVPAGPWDWVHVLGAAERRTEDPALIEYADGRVMRQWLRMSDFWPETPPRFGEQPVFRCRDLHYPRHVQRGMGPTIWAQRIPVTLPGATVALMLPDNPALHLFAITLQGAA
jgi:hypothetical protein